MNIATTAGQSAIACACAVLKKSHRGRILLGMLRDNIDMGLIDGLNETEMRALLSMFTGIRDAGTGSVVDEIRNTLSA